MGFCRRREMEEIQGMKFLSLISSLYRDSHIYTKIPSNKIRNFPNLITLDPFDYGIA